uniref:Periplasmic binding protein n=1 Tax=Cyanothece sp. (strain PCC 7425 / ATCC 29141) TaxID=395961 RepID=B8HXA7_CYAP4
MGKPGRNKIGWTRVNQRRFRGLIWVALMLFTCWQTIACRPLSPVVPSGEQTHCHRVEHAAGTTCVPNRIQRLVTLDSGSFENVVALGLQPIGTTLSDEIPAYLEHWMEGVENIGTAGEPNLERILALKPDLILGLDYHQNLYAQASQIAPTILLKFDHSGEWKTAFQQFGIALKREAIAQQVMHQYQDRLQDLQSLLKAGIQSISSLPFPPQISVVRIYPDSINLYLRDSFCGTILQDAGLARPKAQDLSASKAKQWFNNEIQVSISVERIDQADGDVMFIWTAENTEAGNQVAQKKLEKLQSSPLWQNLKAIQMNRVYFVPKYWIGSGPIAANAVIDDLFKYLVKQA